MKKLLVSLALFVSGFAVMAQPTQLEPKIPLDSFNLDLDSMRIYMLEIVNKFRENRRLPLLTYDSALNIGALNHSLYMVDIGEMTHDETDTTSHYFTGYDPYTRTGRNCGENIAIGFQLFSGESMRDLAYQLFELWKDSTWHNYNMRSGHKFGFGIAAVPPSEGSPDWGYFVMATQVFE